MTTQETQDTDRLSKLEGAYEQMNQRFNDLRTDVNERFNELARGQAALREEIRQVDSKLRSEMHRQTYLIIGVIGGLVTLLRFIG